MVLLGGNKTKILIYFMTFIRKFTVSFLRLLCFIFTAHLSDVLLFLLRVIKIGPNLLVYHVSGNWLIVRTEDTTRGRLLIYLYDTPNKESSGVTCEVILSHLWQQTSFQSVAVGGMGGEGHEIRPGET